MVGNYPNVPAVRIPYDRNGAVMGILDYGNGSISDIAASTVRALNSDTTSTSTVILPGNPYNQAVVLILPFEYDISNFFFSVNSYFGDDMKQIQTSPDSTNGQDGTWTTWVSNPQVSDAVYPDSRTEIVTPGSPVTGVKALRLNVSGGFSSLSPRIGTMHLYGTPSGTPDNLEFWDPDTNVSMADSPAHLDWGDVPRGDSGVRRFRIKNRSATLTASNIRVYLDVQFEKSPTLESQYDIRVPTVTGTWVKEFFISSLGPGAISEVIDVRQNLNISSALGLHSLRVLAEPDEWV